ncbi:hypothetical protein GCM10011610_07160 [Nocardia rhizosphaerihabitans]|uniref:Shikimate kinase n=1 Tax=Nocardia rhizosphaerihabitans TaxID=1691570 RepID=A0ABQ2K4H3_9NOCA|nr:hypothetical protein GCM10011610_07160 [Nocardia rhizosphaerihabitans]
MTRQGQEGAAEDNDAGPPSSVGTEGSAGDSSDAVDAAVDAEQVSTPRARVVLVGPPGSGKSTIGRKLARELGVELYDTDAGIEADTGRTIPEIFATDGEPEFRRIEEEVVRRAVLEHDGVVSLGGGSVLSAQTREVLRAATVVYLEISVGEGLRRTGSSNARPLLNGADPGAKYRELMRIRRPLYREVATVRVRTDGRSPGRVVRMILAKLGLESVRTDREAERTAGGTGSAASGSVTSRPGIGSNRSRARRRARARAAAARRANEQNTIERTGSATTRSGTDTASTGDAASTRSGTPQGEAAGARTTGTRRSRRTRSRRGGVRIRSAAATNRDADSRAATRAAGTEQSGAASPERPAGQRGTPATTGQRAGAGQTGEADRAATQADRTRRNRPRRRGGRRKNNDQKESEQRT